MASVRSVIFLVVTLAPLARPAGARELVVLERQPVGIGSLVEDASGTLWLGCDSLTWGLRGAQGIARVGPDLHVEWMRILGDESNSNVPTVVSGGGNLYAVGDAAWPRPEDDYGAYVARLDGDGNVQWHHRYRAGQVLSVAGGAADGGVYVSVGSAVSRFDPAGSFLWSYRAGSSFQGPWHVDLVESSGGFLMVVADDTGDGTSWIGIADASGNPVTQVLFREASHPRAAATTRGTWLLTFVSGPEVSVLEMDATGAIVRQVDVTGGMGSPRAIPTADGGFLLAGRLAVPGRQNDAALLKLDAAWQIQWQHSYGGELSDAASHVFARPGGWLVYGRTTVSRLSHHWLFEIDAAGNLMDSCADQADLAVTVMPGTAVFEPGTVTTSRTDVPPTFTGEALMERAAVWDEQRFRADPWESADTPGRAHALVPDTPQLRDFCGNPEDWATLPAVAGESYVLETSALGAGADTIVELLDDAGSVVVSDDDGGGGSGASRLAWTATSTGSHVVRVRQKDGVGGPGKEYTLTLQGRSIEPRRWSRVFETGTRTRLHSVIPFADGVLASGIRYSDDTGISGDGILIATDASGRLAWSRLGVGGVARPTRDGGAVVASGGGRVSRLARDGTVTWERTFATLGIAHAEPLQGGGYLVTGNGAGALGVIVLEEDGSLRWATSVDVPGREYARQGIELADGSLLVGGTISPGGAFLVHLDAAGVLLGAFTSPVFVELVGLGELLDGSIVVAGHGSPFAGPTRDLGSAAARIRLDGTLLWARQLQGWGYVEATAAQGSSCGEFVVVGTGDVTGAIEGFVLSLAEDGEIAWQVALDGRQGSDRLDGLGLLSDGGVVVAGKVAAPHASNSDSGWIARMGARGVGPACERTMPGDLVSVPMDSRVDAVAVTVGAAPVMTATAPTLVDVATDVRDACVTAAFSSPPGEVSGPGADVLLGFTGKTRISWSPSAGAGIVTFNVYRGDLATLGASHGECHRQTCVPWIDEPPSPGPGRAWFYLVSGNTDGGEGPLGWTSTGVERIAAASCP